MLTALAEAAANRDEITVAGVARRAGVDRTFFYRHPDLLQQLHAAQLASPGKALKASISVSRASLLSDLHAAQHRSALLAARVQHLERRLSEMLGEQTWRESGLGAPDDIDELRQRIASLEAEVDNLKIELGQRSDELAAARLANRELMTHLNVTRSTA